MATLSTSTTNAVDDYNPGLASREMPAQERTSFEPREQLGNDTSEESEKPEGTFSPISLGGTTALADENDGRPTLKGRRLFILICGLLVNSSILALDQVIITTALPTLSSQFNALAQLPWVVNGFFLTQATGTIAFGQFYTLYPAKYTFLISVLIFEIGSLISAVAPAFWVLILGRAITGWGGGGLVVGMHTIIGQVVRLKDRPMHYSSLGAVFTAASIGGPLIGGVFTDKLTWRWCFYINLPVGAVGSVAVFLALPFYPVRLPPTLRGKPRYMRLGAIDWIGIILALGTTTALVLPLQWGGYILHWYNAKIIALFILCGVLFGLFIAWELWIAKRHHAVVPLRMLKNRSVSGAAASGFFLNIIFGVMANYLPLLYQSRGASALRSGIDILPFMISSVVTLVAAGALVKRIGYYKPWMVGGPWLAAIGAGCMTNRTLLTTGDLIGWQILLGVGFGVAFQNTIMAIQAEYAMEPEMIPQAASIVGFFQRLGPMVGVSITGAIFINYLDHQLKDQSYGLTEAQRIAIRHSVEDIWSPDTGLTNDQQAAVIGFYINAVRHAFFILAPACVLAGATALLVYNRNVNKRGKHEEAKSAESA